MKKKQKKKPKQEKIEPDWDAIERQYRLNVDSLRVLGKKFRTSSSRIFRRAEKHNWRKDQSDEVRDLTANGLLLETAKRNSERNSERNVATKKEIEIAVATNVSVVLGHRKHIARSFDLAKALEGQLEGVIHNRDEIVKEINNSGNDDYTKAKMLKAVALPQNITSLRDLTMILKNVIPLERQAYSLDDNDADKDSGLHEVVLHDPCQD